MVSELKFFAHKGFKIAGQQKVFFFGQFCFTSRICLVSVLLSASVKRFFVSHTLDFLLLENEISFVRIKILLHLGVPHNPFLLHFDVPTIKFYCFGVPDSQCFSLVWCSSGPDMAGRIFSLSSCQGNQKTVKFGCWGHRNRVKLCCR